MPTSRSSLASRAGDSLSLFEERLDPLAVGLVPANLRNGDSSGAIATADSVIITGIIGQPLTEIRCAGGLGKTMLVDECSASLPVRKNPAVMPSTNLSVALLRTSFGFQSNCRP